MEVGKNIDSNFASPMVDNFEPIIHDYDEADIEKYLNIIQEFFMPGWMRIMGVN